MLGREGVCKVGDEVAVFVAAVCCCRMLLLECRCVLCCRALTRAVVAVLACLGVVVLYAVVFVLAWLGVVRFSGLVSLINRANLLLLIIEMQRCLPFRQKKRI